MGSACRHPATRAIRFYTVQGTNSRLAWSAAPALMEVPDNLKKRRVTVRWLRMVRMLLRLTRDDVGRGARPAARGRCPTFGAVGRRASKFEPVRA